MVQGYLISKPKRVSELLLKRGPDLRGKGSVAKQPAGPDRPSPADDPARLDHGGQWGYVPLPSSGNP